MTLPSNTSIDEFQANAPNHFTVRLPRPLHLPGEGWKVGLSSLSLPDTRANLYRLVPKQQYLFSIKWFVLRNGKRTKRRTTVQMDDIDHLDSVVDGEHFMRAIIQHLEGQWRRGRHGDLFVNSQASHWYVKWDWVWHGSEVELKISNTDMVHAGRLNTTKVAIDVALALKMGWLIQKENQDYTLGPNLHLEYIERDINKPWLREIEKGIPNFQLKRDWADLPDERCECVLARHPKQGAALEHECALEVHPFESSVSVRHRQSDAYLARLLGHRRQQYHGRTNHRLVARGAVQTTRARHRLLRTVTHPVLTAPQCIRGSDRKPNRRNQR